MSSPSPSWCELLDASVFPEIKDLWHGAAPCEWAVADTCTRALRDGTSGSSVGEGVAVFPPEPIRAELCRRLATASDGTAAATATAAAATAAAASTASAAAFGWRRAIREALGSAGGAMRLKRLRGAVLAAHAAAGTAEAAQLPGREEECRRVFRRKLRRLEDVEVEGKMVVLRTAAAEATLAATAASAAAAPAAAAALAAPAAAPSAAHHQVVALRNEEDWRMMLQASMETPAVVKFDAAWCAPSPKPTPSPRESPPSHQDSLAVGAPPAARWRPSLPRCARGTRTCSSRGWTSTRWRSAPPSCASPRCPPFASFGTASESRR